MRLVIDGGEVAFEDAAGRLTVTRSAVAHSELLSDLREQPESAVDHEIPFPRHALEGWVRCAAAVPIEATATTCELQSSLSDVSVEAMQGALEATAFLRSDVLEQVITDFLAVFSQGVESFSDAGHFRWHQYQQDIAASISDEQRARALTIVSGLPASKVIELLALRRARASEAAGHAYDWVGQLLHHLLLLPVGHHGTVLRAWFPSIDRDGELTLSDDVFPNSIFNGDEGSHGVSFLALLLLAAAPLSGGQPTNVWSDCPVSAAASQAGDGRSTQRPTKGRARGKHAAAPPPRYVNAPAQGLGPAAGLVLSHAVSLKELRGAAKAHCPTTAGMESHTALTSLHLRDRAVRLGTASAGRRRCWAALRRMRQLQSVTVQSVAAFKITHVLPMMDALSTLPGLHTLRFTASGCYVSSTHDKETYAFFASLAQMPALSDLTLEECLHDRFRYHAPTFKEFSKLTRLTTLTSLELRFSKNVAMPTDAAETIGKAIALITSLRRLIVSDWAGGPSGAVAVSAACEADGLTCLQHLDLDVFCEPKLHLGGLHKEMFNAEASLWAQHLSSGTLSHLTCLVLRSRSDSFHSSPSSQPVPPHLSVRDALRRLPLLQELDLSRLLFNSDHVEQLAAALPALTALTRLDFPVYVGETLEELAAAGRLRGSTGAGLWMLGVFLIPARWGPMRYFHVCFWRADENSVLFCNPIGFPDPILVGGAVPSFGIDRVEPETVFAQLAGGGGPGEEAADGQHGCEADGAGGGRGECDGGPLLRKIRDIWRTVVLCIRRDLIYPPEPYAYLHLATACGCAVVDEDDGSA